MCAGRSLRWLKLTRILRCAAPDRLAYTKGISMTMDPKRLAQLEGAHEHLATRADLANSKLTMAGRMLLISAATDIIMAVDRLES